jgi:hypothetical protein
MPRSTSRKSNSRSVSRSRSRSRTRSRSNSRGRNGRSRSRDRNGRSNSRGRNGRSDSRGRDRSGRSSSRGRDRGGRSSSRGRNGRYNDDRSYNDLCRVHIADLTEKVTKSDIEKSMGKFGEIEEVWMAKNPPCFAFVVFKNKEDAGDAIKEMDGR